MSTSPFRGVMPAITTPFTASGDVDHAFLAEHFVTMQKAGCSGVIPLGSLGEGATLSFDEKVAILRTLVAASGGAPVMPGIAALATRDAIALAQTAQKIGCKGLMVLPAYVHKGPREEAEAHVSAVLRSVDLPCMLYNNPFAYGVDFEPARIRVLAEAHANLVAVKESSGDARRVTAVLRECGTRLQVMVGLDDMLVEGVAAGASGWVAGLVNALPRESVVLFDRARSGGREAARELYEWFLPLLRLDVVPEFVQLIKLVQQELSLGHERVRAPRLALSGRARDEALATIRAALKTRPGVES
ncbi:MAG: dihydrodipicolinate synthase family protein [Planctomycetota bacterium]